MMVKILVLGLGNILMADDGVGVRVVEKLGKKYRFPKRVGIMDGGIRSLALMPCLEGVRRLLVVDAVASSKEPGRLTRLIGEEVLPLQPRRLFQHQDGLAELLMAARLTGLYPEEVVVWGVEPAVVQPGTELSAQVASRLDDLVDRAVEELQRWGIRPRPSKESRPSLRPGPSGLRPGGEDLALSCPQGNGSRLKAQGTLGSLTSGVIQAYAHHSA